ncbi:hypothetical protein HK101_002846 [Irineochytrium annulatum]|nr:hypothetical protein HK101_002846 [Irineochytrium annulatum]
MIGFMIHGAWLIVFVSILATVVIPEGNSSSSGCQPRYLLFVYLDAGAAICACQLVVEFVIGFVSLRGTVSDDRPRQSLRLWVPVHAFLVFLDFVTQGLGFYVIAGPSPLNCADNPAVAVIIRISVSLIFLSLVSWLLFALFTYVRSIPIDIALEDDGGEKWVKTLEFWCFGHKDRARIGDRDVLMDVAKVFADFFRDADTVASDVLVGLLYVRRKQHLERARREERNRASLSRQSPSTSTLRSNHSSNVPSGVAVARIAEDRDEDGEVAYANGVEAARQFSKASQRKPSPMPSSRRDGEIPLMSAGPERDGSVKSRPPVTKEELAEIVYYFQYAEAIYGLPLYMLSNFYVGVKYLLCPQFCGPPSAQNVADSVRTHLGKPGWPFCCVVERPPRNRHTDLLAISLDNGIFRSPYIVALDHDKKAVVVAVRGTLSTADVLVDLNCDLSNIQLPPLTPGGPPIAAKTHAGMLMTAGHIRDEIAGLLEELLKNPSSQYAGYSLVICGHSLGAVDLIVSSSHKLTV